MHTIFEGNFGRNFSMQDLFKRVLQGPLRISDSNHQVEGRVFIQNGDM